MSTSTPAEQEHHGSIAHRLIVATVIGIILPTFFLGLRLLSRRALRIRLYFDDWLIIIAWMLKIGLDISGSLLIQHGMGRPISTVSPEDLKAFLQIQYSGVIQYPLCELFIKLSILYQYRRLFPNRDFKLMANALIAIMLMWCVAVMFTGIFFCSPIRKAWEPELQGSCIALIPFYYGMQIPNVVTDFLILVLPIREIQRLELPLKQKAGVAFTCFFWVISLIFGVVRLATMVELSGQGTDMTWILVNAAIWTTIEPAVQIATACLPAVRVLWHKYYQKHQDNNVNRNTDDSQRLHSISLTSSRPPGGDANDTRSLGGTTYDGSYGRLSPHVQGKDVYV